MILSSQDKFGGIIPPPKNMQDFNNFVSNCALKDCIPINGTFTWTNRRHEFTHIAERLDRFFVDSILGSDIIGRREYNGRM